MMHPSLALGASIPTHPEFLSTVEGSPPTLCDLLHAFGILYEGDACPNVTFRGHLLFLYDDHRAWRKFAIRGEDTSTCSQDKRAMTNFNPLPQGLPLWTI